MKICKKSLAAILFLIGFLCSVQLVTAQKQDAVQDSIIKNAVDSQHYTFYAEAATPANSKLRFLSPGYIVQVSKDTVICDLPYFGQVYTSPINSTEGGIKFTAARFDYTTETKKKGGWDITIKTKDIPETQTLIFTIYENGKAYLQARGFNRQQISFSGYIK